MQEHALQSCYFVITECIYTYSFYVIKPGKFIVLYTKLRILPLLTEIMKSKDLKKEPSGFVFDDDTSDSDDEDLDAFKSKIKEISPGSEDVNEDDDEEGVDTDSDEDSSSEEEDEDESDTDDEAEGPKVVKELSCDQKNQLSKIQQQLAEVNDDYEDTGSENEDDEENSGSEEENDEELGSSSEEENESGDEIKKPIKRKAADSEEVSSKKVKPDFQEDEQKNRFRSKLSKMSIEEIQRLKNKIGLKLFNQKMSGKTSTQQNQADFKRDNKNRPREMSSKKQVSRFREVIVTSKLELEKRDPRFDPNCGEFDDKLFKDNYKFVNEYKSGDLQFLKKQLGDEEDPERRQSIKYLIQRTENQLRQIEHDKAKDEEKKAEREERREQLKAGIKPQYISKSKQKEKDLIKKYETLKQSGGLDKYISKKTKKNVAKDRKRTAIGNL